MSQFPTFAAVYARQTSGATADDARVSADVYKLREAIGDLRVWGDNLPITPKAKGIVVDAWRARCDAVAGHLADLLPVASPDATKAAGFLADARLAGLLAIAADREYERAGWLDEARSSIRRLFLAALADIRQRKRD